MSNIIHYATPQYKQDRVLAYLDKSLAPYVESVNLRDQYVRALALRYIPTTSVIYRYGFILEPLCLVEAPMPTRQLFTHLDYSNPASEKFANQLRDRFFAYANSIRDGADNDMCLAYSKKGSPHLLNMVMHGTCGDVQALKLPLKNATYSPVGAIYINRLMTTQETTIYDLNGDIILGGRMTALRQPLREGDIAPYHRRRKLSLLL